jgi:hypothetical protein
MIRISYDHNWESNFPNRMKFYGLQTMKGSHNFIRVKIGDSNTTVVSRFFVRYIFQEMVEVTIVVISLPFAEIARTTIVGNGRPSHIILILSHKVTQNREPNRIDVTGLKREYSATPRFCANSLPVAGIICISP